MRQIWAKAALAALLCAALGVSAHAVDPSYTGRLDPATGEALDIVDESASMDSGRVRVSDGVTYDYDKYSYCYSLDSGSKELYCSVADGMVLNVTNVSIQIPQDAPVTVYQNGKEYIGSLNDIRDIGEYTVTSQADGRSRQLLRFTIVGDRTNSLKTFTVPDGFYVEEATLDEEDIYFDRYSVNMEQEGAYHILYTCSATGISYKLDTTIDRTPPQLTFTGNFDERVRTRGAVSFYGLEEDDTVIAVIDGQQAQFDYTPDRTGGTFYDIGTYSVTVYDAAGNSATYDFTILTYFNANSLMFFFLVMLCIAGVIIYVRFKRKRLKIG